MYQGLFLTFIMLILLSCSRTSFEITAGLGPRALSEELDPRSIKYTNEFHLLENLTIRLISLDETGNYKLELAESIKKINELEYVFKIKESYFSNGERIRLVDIKKTLERVIKLGSSQVNLSGLISLIEIDGDLLRVRLRKKNNQFLYYLAMPDLGILHKSQYQKNNLKVLDFVNVSSGPFSYSNKGDSFYLVKNIFYKIGENNFPDRVKLIRSGKNDIIEMAFKGDVDIGFVTLRNYLKKRDKILKNQNLRIIGVPSDMLVYIFFNENSKKYKNRNHRRWLRAVIDQEFNVPLEFQGLARRTKQYFPPESKAFLTDLEVDQILKRKIFDKPKDFPEVINLYTYTSGYDVALEPLIKRLEKIPNLKIKVHDSIDPYEKHEKIKNGDIDIFINMMSTDFRMPAEAIFYEFFSEVSSLKDKDGLIKKHFDNYQKAKNKEEEIVNLKEISKIILKSDQIIPLFHNAAPIIYNSSKINLNGVSHLFIYNFWKIRSYD